MIWRNDIAGVLRDGGDQEEAMDESEHDFHVRRSRAELDLAYRAGGESVAEVHLRLAALHLQRLHSRSEGLIEPAAGARLEAAG